MDLKEKLQAFKCKTNTKIVKPQRNRKIAETKKSPIYKDLPPSLDPNINVVFVGYNPGILSSETQHHYAHRSNSFWKLFNESCIIFSLNETLTPYIKSKLDENVQITKFQAQDDNDLLQCSVGFTDLVLRCTRTAGELTNKEKLENVPRLFDELINNKPKYIVIIGKGIWESIVEYLYGKKFKLQEGINFEYGLQIQKPDTMKTNDLVYQRILSQLQNIVNHDCKWYVFPSTSGLAAQYKYVDKLALWNQLSQDIAQDKKSNNLKKKHENRL